MTTLKIVRGGIIQYCLPARLKAQLSRLGDELGYKKRSRGSSLKGRRVAIKYRDKFGNTWAGRGAQPIWLREKLKAGAKLEDFAVQKTLASQDSGFSQGFSEEIQEATQGQNAERVTRLLAAV